MRMYALKILFAVVVLSTPAVGAEAVSRENTSLPQFVPLQARAGIANAGRTGNETRRAAEALSAKFSDDQPPSREIAAADHETFEPASPAAIDPPTNSATSAHVAVLRARSSATSASPKKSKSARPKTAAEASNAQTTKSLSRHRKRMNVGSVASLDSRENVILDAKVGWQTGLIGMLTNPAFWH